MLIKQLHHVIQGQEHLGFLVILELEDLLVPGSLNGLKLLLDLGFLGRHVNSLVDLRLELVQLQCQDILESEGQRFVVELLACHFLDLFPMSVFHELAVERTH